MLIEDLFTPSRIKVDVEAETKEEVFEELVDYMLNAYKLKERNEILAAISEREGIKSTGIAKGIALPHGKTSVVKGIHGVLGISRQGIDYEALDNEPVYLVFLLVSSSDDSQQHIRVLKKLAKLLHIQDFIRDLQQAENADKAHRVIIKYENLLDAAED
jgi:PTS system fructose-specific IIC component/PTS system nitrogen regulatory IIA component